MQGLNWAHKQTLPHTTFKPPDPFANAEAFINAFVVAFPISSIGIQASLIPTTLEKLVKKSSSWQDFAKNAKKELKATREANLHSFFV